MKFFFAAFRTDNVRDVKMDEIKRQIISPSGKYKATVLEKPNYYRLELYIRSEDIDPETGATYGEYWSRKNSNPILIDKIISPEYFAIQELRVLMGEPDSPLSIEWIRDFSFCKDAKFLSPDETCVFCECINSDAIPINAKTIIDFSELCLIEELGCKDEWQMGQIDNNGNIYCWGSYGTIKEAITGL